MCTKIRSHCLPLYIHTMSPPCRGASVQVQPHAMAKTKLFPALFSLLLHGGAATLPPPRVPAVTVHGCTPPAARLSAGGEKTVTMVVDVEGALLRSSSSRSLFPYFMLVAVEAGASYAASSSSSSTPSSPPRRRRRRDVAVRAMAAWRSAGCASRGSAPAAPCCRGGSSTTSGRRRSTPSSHSHGGVRRRRRRRRWCGRAACRG